MIPKNIKREHIIKAIEEIESSKIPALRASKKFLLKYNGKDYPPKYVVSLANEYANNKRLSSYDFSGGLETNSLLKNLGFEIEGNPKGTRRSYAEPAGRGKEFPIKKAHNQRCPECKATVKKMLEKIYGRVENGPKFEVGVLPENFKGSPYHKNLEEIYMALQKHRGFDQFIKAETLPHSDLFVTEPGFIFEYDESQHFTLPRKKALKHYPASLKLGFNKERWIELCGKIDAKDNDPPYRDEQRAWYDTIRDFLPAIKGFNPTIRIFMQDFKWCSLEPDKPSDIEKFKKFMRGEYKKGSIEIKEDPNPSIARIIITKNWKGDQEDAKKVLENVYGSWPKGKKVKFLMTCGGFIQFEWPKKVSYEDIGDNKKPKAEAVNALVEEGEKCAREVISNGLGDRLSEITDYITLGIDSYKDKISTTQNYISELHIELVFAINLRDNHVYWTGKSYPTSAQQEGLVRITDLKKHFFHLNDVGKVMMLGCHDLTIFNPRAKNSKGWRKSTDKEFKALAIIEKPEVVLHHPHTTVKKRTWLNSWSNLTRILPSVKKYAGAGRYFEPGRKRDNLDDVLGSTKSTDTIDFVIN